MSPTSSVIRLEMNAIVSATPKIIWLVWPSWTVTPLTRARIARSCRSPSSSSVTSAGPQGANVSIALPAIHCDVACWTSRAVTSLKAIAPATCSSASSAAMSLPRRPITTASSAS